jgi:hypothetical protein
VGINWWENDPWLSAQSQHREVKDRAAGQELEDENRRLRERVRALESGGTDRD